MAKIILLFFLLTSIQTNAQKTAYFLFNKGFNYMAVDKPASIKFFTQSLKKDSTFSLSYYYRGLANYKLGNYQLAIADFNKALINDNKIIKCHIYKGFAYQHINEKVNALRSFEEYFNSKLKARASDYLVIAKAKAAIGDTKGASINYKLALQKNPSEEYLYHLFLDTYTHKKYKKALVLINKIIQTNPLFYGYYLYKGKVELAINNYDKALKCFDLSLKLNKKIADSYFFKGNILDTLGRFNDALTNYNEAIKLNQTDGAYYFKRGNTKMTLKDKNGACLDWKTANKLGYYANFDKIKTFCEQIKIYSK